MSITDVIELSAERTEEGECETHRFQLSVPSDLEYFEGHFDGDPILAAVVQLDVIIVPRIERLWPDLGPMERATKMKFRSPIRADDEITLELSRRAGRKSVNVTMVRGEDPCASGSLFFS